MSHSYLGLYGYGHASNGIEDVVKRNRDALKNEDLYAEPMHIQLHASSGGMLNGRITSMTIGEGHIYNSGGNKEATIKLTKKDAMKLIQELQKWIVDEETSDDYGTMTEIESDYKKPSETKIAVEAKYGARKN
jgi:hypothetical protein